ncbi:MAG TPA: GTP cyclohydrolase I, partial [bacterium]|nr:GTP cyclohydrolase I [bacterium]
MTNHRIQPAAALREEAALSGLDPLEQVTRDLLLQIGENPDREGLRRTPLRFARAWRFLTRGYDQDIVEIINNAVFEEDADEMVVVTDIDFFSLCEHHML